jgi:hypothetical protein
MVDGVAGDIGAGEAVDLDFRLGVGLDGVQRSILDLAAAAAGFAGEDLGLDFDLEGVAARSISGSRRRRRGVRGGGRGECGFERRGLMGLAELGFRPFGAHSH